jgi:protein disulfide-isomerase
MKTPRCLLPLLCSLLVFSTSGVLAKSGWTDDYEKAVAQAKQEKKIVLVDFTGSDWCGWCIKLDKEVFAKPAFKTYAKDKLVLVEIDFPQAKKLPRKKEEANEALQQKYGVEGFPTVIVLDSEGKKIGQLGYVKGGPEAFIAELEKITAKTGA